MRSAVLISFVLALAYAAPPGESNNVYEVDLDPQEAEKYIRAPPFGDPTLSRKVADLPLIRSDDPRFRSADAGPTNGHYWKNGKEIENTQDYVEEVYNAAQFHGQDGLGLYAYGYKTPESSKIENREHNGDVSGSYVYKDANDRLIKVRYWADNEGFHQEDNLPKPEQPEGPTETPEVREARLAHQKAWEEAAAASAQNAGGNEYDYDDQHQGAGSENQETSVPLEANREGKAYAGNLQGNQNAYYQTKTQQGVFQPLRSSQPQQSSYPPQQAGLQQQQAAYRPPQQQQYPSNIQQSIQQSTYQQNQASYQEQTRGNYNQLQQQSSGNYNAQTKLKSQNQEAEYSTEYPPKGFFYSFEYPVSILRNIHGNENIGGGSPVDLDTVGVSGPFKQAPSPYKQAPSPYKGGPTKF